MACFGSLISKCKVLLKTTVTQNPAAPHSRRAEIGRSGSDGGQGRQQALVLLVGQEVGHCKTGITQEIEGAQTPCPALPLLGVQLENGK